MRLFHIFLLCLTLPFHKVLLSQEVPRRIIFANMELKIEDEAAATIKDRMKKLTQNQKFYSSLRAKYDVYAPIIERVLRENGVPEEFKSLCVMESSLNPMAVSTSNAVGYWQFKKESGTEVGLRIDNEIDERKNIVSATVGACKYLKRNNGVLNNWILTCQSYNVGLGGTKKSLSDNSLIGAKNMVIDGKCHEYVLKFLAFTLLFKDEYNHGISHKTLLEYTNGQQMTLEEIANNAGVDLNELKTYNCWLLTNKIPSDRAYPVIIPVDAANMAMVVEKLKMGQNIATLKTNKEDEENVKPAKKKWWQIFSGKDEDQLNGTDVPVIMSINGIRAIQAKPQDNSHKLSNLGGIRYKKFLKYNEMRSFDELKPGRFYYLEDKKTEAQVLFHIVMPEESLWDIAQKYGITTKSIVEKNRMNDGEALVMGRKLYLRFPRPEGEDIIIEPVKLPSPPKDTIIKYKTKVVRDTIIRRDTVIKTDTVHSNGNKNTEVILERPKNFEEDPKTSTTPPTSSNSCTHLVQQGQTLYAISKKYGILADSIISWNNIQNKQLSIGMILTVCGKRAKEGGSPVGEVTSPPLTTNIHKVQPGETLYAIARKYKVSVEEIMKINQLTDSQLKLGMDLKLPSK